MSGTSLDGLDLAAVRFHFKEKWEFELIASQFKPYSKTWKNRLQILQQATALEYAQMDVDLGIYFGKETQDFIQKNNLKPDFIASHGHTIFHQPEKKLTTQIGSLPHIAAETNLKTIGDFRTLDVALGGQGAPLVPIGDELLFGQYDFCLNLGGIANISAQYEGKRIAFDVCACNMVLNYLSQKLGKPFDKNGDLAKSGKFNQSLFKELNQENYFKKSFPKSTGKEWVTEKIIPILNQSKISIEDKLHTFVKHISFQLTVFLNGKKKAKGFGVKGKESQKPNLENSQTLNPKPQTPNPPNLLLITGGGALNQFLIESLKEDLNLEVVIPSKKIIEFKEAIVFAFLGLLRLLEQKNCLKSVTGAKIDNIGGAVYVGFNSPSD